MINKHTFTFCYADTTLLFLISAVCVNKEVLHPELEISIFCMLSQDYQHFEKNEIKINSKMELKF